MLCTWKVKRPSGQQSSDSRLLLYSSSTTTYVRRAPQDLSLRTSIPPIEQLRHASSWTVHAYTNGRHINRRLAPLPSLRHDTQHSYDRDRAMRACLSEVDGGPSGRQTNLQIIVRLTDCHVCFFFSSYGWSAHTRLWFRGCSRLGKRSLLRCRLLDLRVQL